MKHNDGDKMLDWVERAAVTCAVILLGLTYEVLAEVIDAICQYVLRCTLAGC